MIDKLTNLAAQTHWQLVHLGMTELVRSAKMSIPYVSSVFIVS